MPVETAADSGKPVRRDRRVAARGGACGREAGMVERDRGVPAGGDETPFPRYHPARGRDEARRRIRMAEALDCTKSR